MVDAERSLHGPACSYQAGCAAGRLPPTRIPAADGFSDRRLGSWIEAKTRQKTGQQGLVATEAGDSVT